MEQKRQPTDAPPPQENRSADGDRARETDQKKPYRPPTISRHGNLRLMTQLE